MKLYFNRAHQRDGSNGWSEGVGELPLLNDSMILTTVRDLTEEMGDN